MNCMYVAYQLLAFHNVPYSVLYNIIIRVLQTDVRKKSNLALCGNFSQSWNLNHPIKLHPMHFSLSLP